MQWIHFIEKIFDCSYKLSVHILKMLPGQNTVFNGEKFPVSIDHWTTIQHYLMVRQKFRLGPQTTLISSPGLSTPHHCM